MRIGTVTLLVVFGLAFVACGGGGAEGTYGIDKAAVKASMMEKLKADTGGELPPAAADMMSKQLDMMSMKLVLTGDGKFTVKGKMGPSTFDAAGTWKVDGKKISMTTTHEDGKETEKPETKSADYEDGKITINDAGPFAIILIRE